DKSDPQQAVNVRRGGFVCRNGERFADRPQFDDQLKQRPGKLAVRDCCNRALPKGSSKVDENGTFASTKERADNDVPSPNTC
ncbi:MAG: hypothetical protein M1311_00190, partial [Thaumarchaeota archaeon]|nr:hypothetical protein [Nitrososphaerota archaeon]